MWFSVFVRYDSGDKTRKLMIRSQDAPSVLLKVSTLIRQKPDDFPLVTQIDIRPRDEEFHP